MRQTLFSHTYRCAQDLFEYIANYSSWLILRYIGSLVFVLFYVVNICKLFMGAWRSYGYSYKQLSLVVICQGHVSIHSPSFIDLALCFQEQKICTVFHSGLLIKSLPKLPETYQNHLETYGFHYLWIDFPKLYFAGNFFFLFFFFNHFAYQSLPKNYRGHSSGSLSSSLIATESYQSLVGVGKYWM